MVKKMVFTIGMAMTVSCITGTSGMAEVSGTPGTPEVSGAPAMTGISEVAGASGGTGMSDGDGEEEAGQQYYRQYGQAKASGDMIQAMRYLKDSAGAGYLKAQEQLGENLEKGEYGTADAGRAMEWYRKAAAQGSPKAMMSIGLLYFTGNGVGTDYQTAMEWMMESIRAGDRKGPRYAGLMFEKGLGVQKDYGAAAAYYQLGAERGDITSQYYLGRLYEFGQGVPQDYGMAMQWYETAAGRGDKTAAVGMIGMAGLYEYGKGTEPDWQQADSWYQKAAATGYEVEYGEPLQVTAVTEVFGNGQKITAVILEYDREIQNRSVASDSFFVQGRTIMKAYANTEADRADAGTDGRYVILELSTADELSSVYEGGIINGGNGPTGTTGSGVVKAVYASVEQEKTIMTEEDIPLLPNGGIYPNTEVKNRTVDDFQQKIFRDPDTGEYLMYNLYIPEDYSTQKEYPLILFMADASADGDDVMITLRQGNGAVVWAGPEEQAKHPCFVLAPQFRKDAPETMNDTVMKLIGQLESGYRIDSRRIYTSGQSAGCIRSIDMDIRYPGFFAGLLLVAGQSDPDAMRVMKDENIWIIISEGDKRGYPGMNASVAAWEADGAAVAKGVWDARWSREEYARAAADMRAQGSPVHYTMFRLGTTWDGNPEEETPNEHNSSMHFAYDIEEIRDWLFEQVLGEQHP